MKKKYLEKIKNLLKPEKSAKEANITLKNWYSEKYEKLVVQRNILFLVMVGSIITIAFSVLAIRYIKSSRTIEPFVIEIEPNSGVPTVVDPVSVKAYSANQAIQKYFIMKYITAREGYLNSTYEYNFNTVVRVLSSPKVYYDDYRPKFSMRNPNSPYNLYGTYSSRTVTLKSIIFQSPTTAQVRIKLEVNGSNPQVMNKICLVEFEFANLKMSAEDRLINPLGFQVTFFTMQDEE